MKRERRGLTRAEARREIIQAANREKLRLAARRWPHYAVRPYNARHIQQAVCMCRRRGLVSTTTLVKAGFRAVAS